MGLADFAGGVQQSIQTILQRRLEEQAIAQRAAMEQAQLEQGQQRIAQGDRGLDLEEARLNAPEPEPAPMVVGGRLVTRTGNVLFEPPAEPERPTVLSPGSALAQGGRIVLKNPSAPSSPAQEPLVAIIGEDGNPVLVPRSQAAGARPASNREQGRPVGSPDANRIADFDTSLDDLDVLAGSVGDTGVLPKLGAMAPNVITEMTGFGVDAKQRQADIDRVKQVIGKALEGGVLRKEDEYKYEKILPTIADHPDVVKSKLKGLNEAITLRRQTLLDSLGDAGYDTAKYNARPPRQPKGGGDVAMVAPDGRRLRVPADKVAEMEAKGAKRQ